MRKLLCLLGLHKRSATFTGEYEGKIFMAKKCPICGTHWFWNYAMRKWVKVNANA